MRKNNNNRRTTSQENSTNLAAKVRELAENGYITSFLAQSFLKELERRNNFEQKGAWVFSWRSDGDDSNFN